MRAVKIAALQLVLIFLIVLPARALNVEVANFKLANGMEVVVIPNHRAPVVTHMVWYRVGSADEVSGKSGLGAFSRAFDVQGNNQAPARRV